MVGRSWTLMGSMKAPEEMGKAGGGVKGSSGSQSCLDPCALCAKHCRNHLNHLPCFLIHYQYYRGRAEGQREIIEGHQMFHTFIVLNVLGFLKHISTYQWKGLY